MKVLRFLFAFLALGFILSSCQKDFSFEAGNARGALGKDAAGDCLPILVNGNYFKDTTLNATNYVDIQVDFTKIGVYTIKTDTVNGYSFSATASTALLGPNTVRLIGSGKPVRDGFDVFTVKFDGGTCTFDVVVNLGAGGGGGTSAIFTFPNTGAACTGATQTTNFFATLPTNLSTHFITLLVDVSQAGTYSLSTTVLNGLTFTATGSFAATGNGQPLILRANGTPTASGLNTYNFSTTTPTASSCAFDLTVQAAPSLAVFTFNCGTASTTGTYQVGTAMATNNTIILPITVTTPGAYTISTVVNGITFSGSNVLTASSPSITLFATVGNLPTASGLFPATVTFGTATCIVPILFSPATVATNFISANINGAATLTTFNVGASGIDISGTGLSVNIFGDNNATGIENIDFTVAAASLVINTNYTVNQIATGVIVDANYTNASNMNFSDQSNLIPQLDRPFTVRFTQITTLPNRVRGTFTGRVDDGATGFVYFTNGTFDITY